MQDASVIITPTGQAYRVACDIITALHNQCQQPACPTFEPHVTLQYVRAAPDPAAVAEIVADAARGTAPFEVRFTDLGTFDSVPGVHINLEPTPELLAFYERVKTDLDRVGLSTYPYDATTWRPHVSLSCQHWSSADIGIIQSMFGRLAIGFTVRRVQVSALASTGWRTIRDLPLGAVEAGNRQDPPPETAEPGR